MGKTRILPILLSAALILSLMPEGSLASTVPQVSVEAILLGDTVTATVSLTANSGITDGHVVLGFDPDVLVLAEAQAGELLTGCFSGIHTDPEGKASLIWMGGAPQTRGGTLMILRFRVCEDPGDETPLTLSVRKIHAGGLDITAQTSATGTFVFFTPTVLLEADNPSQKVIVKVYLTGALHVTEGKILLDYDGTRLYHTACVASDAGTVFVDSASKEDRISIAWTNTDLPSGKTLLATLQFSEAFGLAKGTVVSFIPTVSKLDISGTDISASARAETLDLTLVGGSADWPAIANPRAEFENPYMDIDGHWAYDEILAVTGSRLFFGRTKSAFVPDGKITRAEFVTVLWRMSGKPMAASDAIFTDIPVDSWCGTAVGWAAVQGMTNGVSMDRFDPEADITSQMMAVMLYRFAVLTGRDTCVGRDLGVFPDCASIPPGL